MAVTAWQCVCILLLCAGSLSLADQHDNDNDRFMHRHRTIISRSFIRAEETDAEFWNDMAQGTLADKLAANYRKGVAKNVVMFLGDGMSIPTLTATRIVKAGEQGQLLWENFPALGHSKTYCVDVMVADSACSATAYLSGIKANLATIGLTAGVLNKDCAGQQNTSYHVDSIVRKAQIAGKSTGIVTTTRITHASPSGAYAHIAERDWESDFDMSLDFQETNICDDIAEQLIRGETGKNLNVIFGGGRSKFRSTLDLDEERRPGQRLDNTDLIAEWISGKAAANVSHAWVWDKDTLKAVDLAKTDYVLGLFETGHLEYHLDNNPLKKPSLPELTQHAITVLSKNPQGFFLFVEGGRIDHAHHDTRTHRAVDETLEMEKAVEVALNMTDPEDTLIVITADHAHTMTLGGYPLRGAGIYGISTISEVDGKPLSTLAYANGPGYKRPAADGSRYDLTNDNMANDKYEFPSLAPRSSETHGGDDVAVFAQGPWEHLFVGTYEQNYIQHAMAYAACLGDGLTACTNT